MGSFLRMRRTTTKRRRKKRKGQRKKRNADEADIYEAEMLMVRHTPGEDDDEEHHFLDAYTPKTCCTKYSCLAMRRNGRANIQSFKHIFPRNSSIRSNRH